MEAGIEKYDNLVLKKFILWKPRIHQGTDKIKLNVHVQVFWARLASLGQLVLVSDPLYYVILYGN